MSAAWIGYIEVPPSVETNIRTRRGVTGSQVRAACQWPATPLRAAWHEHPEYGRRLIVFARDEQGRLLKAVPQPVDIPDGTWRLRTVIVGTPGRMMAIMQRDELGEIDLTEDEIDAMMAEGEPVEVAGPFDPVRRVRFELVHGSLETYRWRIVAANGEILATSAATYRSPADARRAVSALTAGSPAALIRGRGAAISGG